MHGKKQQMFTRENSRGACRLMAYLSVQCNVLSGEPELRRTKSMPRVASDRSDRQYAGTTQARDKV